MLLDPAEIEGLAAEWLIRRHDAAGWNADAERALNAWLAESYAHQLAYWRLEAAWTRADRLNALNKPASTRSLVAMGRRALPLLARVAVVLVLLAGALAGARMFLSREHAVTYQTAIGGHRAFALADGSRIELNTDTTLRVSDGAKQRRIWLEKGEAYFQVKHDSARQFVVMAGDHRIVDLGTKFVIRRDVHRLEVTLVEGRAQIEPTDAGSKERSLLLKAGDVVIATPDAMALVKRPSTLVADSLGWRRGLLIFRNTPLADVADEFNRYNKRKLVVLGDDARNLGVGGHFQANNVEIFARVAEGALGLHVQSHAGEIVISR